MTKTIIMLVVCMLAAPVAYAQSPDPMQQFVDQVNEKWHDGDNNAILQIINTKLQASPNDILALGVKAYFHVYGINDLTLARAAALSFDNLVQASTSANANTKLLSKSVKDEINEIPLSESGALSSQEQAGLRTAFPNEFPMIKKILSIAKSASTTSP